MNLSRHQEGGSATVRRPGRAALILAPVLLALSLPLSAPAQATILDDGNFHQIMNRQSAECLDVTGASTHNGAEVKIWRCVNGGNQRWRLASRPVPSAYKQIQVEHTGGEPEPKCLSIHDGNVVQDACKDRPDQRWRISYRGAGYSNIVNWNGQCLDKAGGDVVVHECWNPWWQQWQSLG